MMPTTVTTRAAARRDRLVRIGAATCALAAVVLVVVIWVAGSAVGGVVETMDGPYRLADEFPWMLVNAATVFAGATLAVRLPRNPIGWCLIAIGLGFLLAAATAFVPAAGIAQPDPAWWAYLFAWLRNWVWVVGAAGMLYLGLLFPTGAVLSPRWRVFGWIAAGVLVAVALAAAVHPQFESAPTVANPVGIQLAAGLIDPLIAMMLAAQVAAFASLVARFWRSRGVERQQLKWVAFGASVLGGWLPLNWSGVAPRWTVFLGPLIVLAAIVVAVTRYRLYDIDRIVSRTVSYLVLTALLAGVYVAGVVGLGGLARSLTGGAGGDVAVAASTLAVAALFGPARRRIQALVDRRFNRARYDAQQTVEAFAQRLRDEVDPVALAAAVREAATRTMQPMHSSIWLTGGRP